MTLNDFMLSEIFTFLLVFCRVGTTIMLMPGFGEAYISARYRLIFALMFSLVLTPAMQNFPAPPATVFELVNLMFAEILTGAFFGTITRMLLSAVSTAGMIIAYQSSLASALVQDVTISGGQGSSMGNLMGLAALVMMFTMDMHHLMLQSIHDSYNVFAVGSFPDVQDFSSHAVRTMNDSFLVALQMSAPHIVIGLILYLAGGIIGKLMPSFQVFFILQAPQLMLSFFVLMISIGAIMGWYMDYFAAGIGKFVE